MLSIKSGEPFSVIKKKDKIIETVYIKDFDDSNTEKLNNDIEELIPKSFFTKHHKNITDTSITLIKRALKLNDISILKTDALIQIYNDAKLIIDENKYKVLGCKRDEIFQLLPPKNHFSCAVFGPSGVGKSYWISQFLHEFKKKYKNKRPIYIFSPIQDDPAYKSIKPIYIRIDESIIENPLKCYEFENGLCVFDDIESLSKDYQKIITDFRDTVLEIGRHSNIDIISVHHVIQGGSATKKIINES